MSHFERIIYAVARRLSWVSAGALAAMMAMICAEIVSRSFYRSIEGAYEIVGFLAAITISLAIAHTQIQKGHVAVEVVVLRLKKQLQIIIDCFNWFVSIILFALITWRLCVYGIGLQRTGEVSPTLWWPVHPIVYVVALGSFGLCLILLIDFYKTLIEAIRK